MRFSRTNFAAGLVAALALGWWHQNIREPKRARADTSPASASDEVLPVATLQRKPSALAAYRNALSEQRSGSGLFDRMLPLAERLDTETLARLATAAPNEGDRKDRSSRSLLMHVWAEGDPKAALAFALAGQAPVTMESFIEFSMAEWVRRDPAAAIAWLKQRANREGEDEWINIALRGAAIRALAAADPERAIQFIKGEGVTRPYWTEEPRLFEQTEHWEQLLEGGEQDAFLRTWMRVDPVSAQAWLSDQDDQRRREAQRHVAFELIEAADDRVAEALRLWRESPQGPDDFAFGIDLVRNLAIIDPGAAPQAFHAIASGIEPPIFLDVAIRDVALALNKSDPAAAFEWVRALTNRQDIAAEQVFREWSRFAPDDAKDAFSEAGWTRDWIDAQIRIEW